MKHLVSLASVVEFDSQLHTQYGPSPTLATSRKGLTAALHLWKESALATQDSTVKVPTSVYRYYDDMGLLLYVGVTSRGIKRNTEHISSKEWWQWVTRQDVEHFTGRHEALQVERGLIKKFHPPFNKVHNPTHELDRAAYVGFRTMPRSRQNKVSYDLNRSVLGPMRNTKKIALTVTNLDSRVLLQARDLSNDVLRRVDLSARDFPIASAGRKGKLHSLERGSNLLSLVVNFDKKYQCRAAQLMFRSPSKGTDPITIKLVEMEFGMRRDLEVKA